MNIAENDFSMNFSITKIPKIYQLNQIWPNMTLKLGQNQKPNHEKFSLGLTVTPALAELGLAQLKLVYSFCECLE